MGLVDMHAYSLISTHELDRGQGKPKVRLVKIRNPYGLKEWIGDWSDKDTKNWTPELRQQVGSVDAEDGVFFIKYEDYLDFFYNTTICKYADKGKRSLVLDQHLPGSFNAIKFTVHENHNSPVLIVLHQAHHRFLDRKLDNSFQYARMNLKLAKVVTRKELDNEALNDMEDRFLAFVDGDSNKWTLCDIELPSITAGDYILFAECNWTGQHAVRKNVITIYGPESEALTRISSKLIPYDFKLNMENWL